MCCVCCRHTWSQVLASTFKPCWRTTSLLSTSRLARLHRTLVDARALDSPSQTAISGYACLLQSLRSNVVSPHTHSCRFLACLVVCVGSELPLLNRHLGVCKPPPVASLQCRRPAHPLVSVSMGCWFASWRHAKAFAIQLQLVQAPGSRAAISCAAPTVGASSRQHRSAARGAGRRTRQQGRLSTKANKKHPPLQDNDCFDTSHKEDT